jgi:hypothetical protein
LWTFIQEICKRPFNPILVAQSPTVVTSENFDGLIRFVVVFFRIARRFLPEGMPKFGSKTTKIFKLVIPEFPVENGF